MTTKAATACTGSGSACGISPNKLDIVNNNNLIEDNYVVEHSIVANNHNSSKQSTGPSDSSNFTLDDSIDDGDFNHDQDLMDENLKLMRRNQPPVRCKIDNNACGEVIDVEEDNDLMTNMDNLHEPTHKLQLTSSSQLADCFNEKMRFDGSFATQDSGRDLMVTVEELEKRVNGHEAEIERLISVINDMNIQIKQLSKPRQSIESREHQLQNHQQKIDSGKLSQRNRSLSSLSSKDGQSTPVNSRYLNNCGSHTITTNNVKLMKTHSSLRPSSLYIPSPTLATNSNSTTTRLTHSSLATPRSLSSLHATGATSPSMVHEINANQSPNLSTLNRKTSEKIYNGNFHNTLSGVRSQTHQRNHMMRSPSLWCNHGSNSDDNNLVLSNSNLNYSVSKSSRASSVSNLSTILTTRSDRNSSKIQTMTRDLYVDLNNGLVRLIIQDISIQMHIPTRVLKDYSPTQLIGPPPARFRLAWVHGYRGRDCRSNLHFLPTGECLYFIGNVVLLYNVADRMQRHYLGHTNDVRSITVHPNRLIVASGQSQKRGLAQIRIWNSASLVTYHVLDNFTNSILCLAFSRVDGGAILAVVDDSTEHSITLWDWQKGDNVQLAEARDGPDIVLSMEFHPIDQYKLITCGKNHIHFWDTEGFTLTKRPGLYDTNDKPKFVLCLTFNEIGDTITGDSNGNIVVWPLGSNRPERFIEDAHDGGVFVVLTLKDGTFLSGGGKDRRVVEWDESLRPTGREIQLPEQFGGIRTLCVGKKHNILLGTTRNFLLQGNMTNGFKHIIVQGHTEPLHALAVHPTQDQYVVGGQDRLLHLFDSISRTIVWTKCMQVPIYCASYSPDAQILVIGSEQGQWNVIDADTHEIVFGCSDGPPHNVITCVKFSPSGQMLALGCTLGIVYVYNVANFQFARIGTCVGHKSPVKHIDWSTDNQYMQTQGTNFELMVWRAAICRPITNVAIERNIQWFTQNCTVGFNVFGIWSDESLASYVSGDRTNDHKMFVTSCDQGFIRIFQWPANTQHCLSHTFLGASQCTDTVRFTSDDGKLLALGSQDCVISEWNVDHSLTHDV